MNIGFIGTGNMGTILIDAFIEAEAISATQLHVTNRTLTKAYRLQEKHPGLSVETSIEDVIQNTDLIFLCVKPLEMHPILKQHEALFTNDKCLISITSPISVTQLESILPCSVARVIPSITNSALSGISLTSFGENCTEAWKEKILQLFQAISTPIPIENDVTRVSSDIISCGPAFVSFLLQRLIEGAVAKTAISREQATALTSGMIIGMGKLLEKELFTLPTLQAKVCVKGGITGEGIRVLENELGDVFEHLIEATHAKFEEDLEKVAEQFHGE